VFWPGGALVPETVTVNVRDRTHAISATVELAAGAPAEGVLLAMGTALGGWSFHLRGGCLRYVHNYLGKERHVVASDVAVPPGTHELTFAFERAGDFCGTGRLLVDGEVVGEAPIPNVTPVRYSITGGGITCGWEQGPPVGHDYDAPFRFTGTLRRVVVEVDGPPHRDPDAEVDAILSEQ
jgi:arylsulfatase